MKKKIMILLVIIMFVGSIAFAGEKRYKSAILIETNSGRILYGYNKDEVLPQASITKLMTYYVFNDLIKNKTVHPYDLVTVDISNFKLPSDGSSVALAKGQKVTIDELLNTLLIASANNSACQLQNVYKQYGGTIIDDMNKRAKRIGMKNSNFVNTTGLTEKINGNKIYNTTTVYDTSVLAKKILNDYPETLEITSKRNYKFNSQMLENTDKLLFRSRRVDGLKTGHTSEAGYCLVSTEDLTKKNGNDKPFRLLSVVFGSPTEFDRVEESQNLLKYGEQNFENRIVVDKNKIFSEKNEFYKVGFLRAKYNGNITMLAEKNEKIDVKYSFNEKLTKSIKKGEKIGKITIKNKGTGESKEYGLYADNDYKSVSFIKKMFLYIKNLFK